MHSLSPALEKLKAEELYRSRRVTETPQSVLVSIKGRSYLSFCSNDYLGLANHPEVIEALKSGADRWGVGAGAAHLVNGHSAAHHALEEELADFTHRPRALLFSTGYMANLGVAAALTGRGDAVFEDRLNHASLLDGGLLSGARFQRFAHADAEALARRMEGIEGRKLVMTDGVFSMDGDVAPLDRLVPVCRENDAWLMVDDAHGLGVVGEQGRGTAALFDMGLEDVPILMGTLGKGLGTFGAFVAGSDELIETLIQKARPYIYTTASPPAVAEATRVSLRLAREEQWRREHLRNLVTRFRKGAMQLGLQLMDSPTPIQPIVIGESADAMHASRVLEERGLLITAIRPPTVAKGTARLRITFSAQHTEAHIDRLLSVLDEVRLA